MKSQNHGRAFRLRRFETMRTPGGRGAARESIMRKYAILAAVGAFLLLFSGVAIGADEEFGRLDQDKDGKISKEEFVRWYPVKVWKKADGDGDGYVQETEWIPVREGLAQYKRQEARDAEVKQ